MKGLSKYQRNILAELMGLTNDLGGTLDGTATSGQKYIDRQRAMMNVYKVIYGLFGDNPLNDNRDDDIETIEKNMQILRDLKDKVYPDKNGFYAKD